MQRVKLGAYHCPVVSCYASLFEMVTLTNLLLKKVESKVKTFLSQGEMIYCLKLHVFSGLYLPLFHIATILFIFWTRQKHQFKMVRTFQSLELKHNPHNSLTCYLLEICPNNY